MALDIVPLENAVLCAECEVISASISDNCPACGSRSLLCLSRVLGGSIGQTRAVLLPITEMTMVRDCSAVVQLAA